MVYYDVLTSSFPIMTFPLKSPLMMDFGGLRGFSAVSRLPFFSRPLLRHKKGNPPASIVEKKTAWWWWRAGYFDEEADQGDD